MPVRINGALLKELVDGAGGVEAFRRHLARGEPERPDS